GFGFVLIHMLGLAVATKQPAMTAAVLANTLEDRRPKQLDRLAETALNVIRSQIVAVLGNVGIALPAACLIALAWMAWSDTPIAPPDKLEQMIRELDPLSTGSVLFAAIAGVGLFLSGLVAGYFDNQARYLQLGDRVARSSRFRWLGKERAAALGRYIDGHYGAILGNLFVGMYLGLASGLGEMTGLPIDIRHVTLSSANLGLAATTLGWHTLPGAILMALLGVLLIGAVNLVVSFALALYVAMKSKRLGLAQLFALGRAVGLRILRDPLTLWRGPDAPADRAAATETQKGRR
ncbi:MAG: hypothetical protein ACK4XK_13740, partial [Casimicrobiaceae bacterium]